MYLKVVLNKYNLPQYILIMFALVLFYQCKKSNCIKQWELQKNMCKVIKINSSSEFNAFYGHDSLLIAESLLLLSKQNKFKQLQQQHDSLQNCYNKTNLDFLNNTNPTLKGFYITAIKSIEQRIIDTRQIIEFYNTEHDSIAFYKQFIAINYYKKNSSALLGYTKQICFTGIHGQLPENDFCKIYFFDKKQRSIIAQMQ